MYLKSPALPAQRRSSRTPRFAVSAAAAAAVIGLATVETLTGGPAGAATAVGIFPDTLPPTIAADTDNVPVELGVKFTPTQPGTVSALQYYQGAQATGVNRATLWSPAGTAIAQVTFASTTEVGWRTIPLATPVKLGAGQTYTASYFARHGRYPTLERNLLAAKTVNGFRLPPSAGVYKYSSTGGFPTSTWRGSNYLVDLVYTPAINATTGTKPTSTTATKPTATATPSSTARPLAPGGPYVVLGRSFPSAATTGVPTGTALSPYTGPCSIQINNAVIDRKTVNCDLRILAQNVKITNSVINGTIYSDPDYFNGSFTITDSEVRMGNHAGTGIGETNFVATRVEVTGGSRSVNCAANCTLQDSYLHGQYTDHRGIDHESAIRMGSGSTIRHNTLSCDSTPVPPDAGCSAALTGYGDFAIVQKNTIDNNLIDGGPHTSTGYCAYGGSTTGKPFSAGVNNIRFTNNIWMRGPSGQCGIWGPITSFDSTAPGNVWSNNLWNDGKVVPAAN